MSANTMVSHLGGCHCRAVRFKVQAPKQVTALDCNCSICAMKNNTHFVVPKRDFELLEGQDSLTLYQFNTKQAKHYFCKICGICSFYIPRSDPDGYAVTVACLDPGTMERVEVEGVDGQNWEKVFSEQAAREAQQSVQG